MLKWNDCQQKTELILRLKEIGSFWSYERNSLHLMSDKMLIEECLRWGQQAELVTLFKMYKNTPIFSEKAKSEAIIAPIVREIRRNNPHLTVFSGYSFNIEKDADLNGVPDFMFSARSHIIEPQSPIFCLFESKNKSPEEVFAQCGAEMYAAKNTQNP